MGRMAAAKGAIVMVGDVTVDWMFVNLGGDPRGVDFCGFRSSGAKRLESRRPVQGPRAFICVDMFRHGALSVQAIVELNSLSGKLRFDRSDLPIEHQSDLHADGRLFGDFVEGGP